MAGLSFDSGLLIRFDRGDPKAWAWLKRATERGEVPMVSSVAVAESWRDGRTQARLASLLNACEVAAVDGSLARLAGEALAAVPGAGVADALIAAGAARAGATLVTEDHEDMRALADGYFRGLRVASAR
jgi:predicted nucleic acid-binding protein